MEEVTEYKKGGVETRRMLWKRRKGTMKMGVRVDQWSLRIGGYNGGTNFEWNMKSCEGTFEVRSCAWNLRRIWCDATTRPTRFHHASWTCQWQWIKINITFQADISRAMIDGVDGEKSLMSMNMHVHTTRRYLCRDDQIKATNRNTETHPKTRAHPRRHGTLEGRFEALG